MVSDARVEQHADKLVLGPRDRRSGQVGHVEQEAAFPAEESDCPRQKIRAPSNLQRINARGMRCQQAHMQMKVHRSHTHTMTDISPLARGQTTKHGGPLNIIALLLAAQAILQHLYPGTRSQTDP